MTDTNSPSPLAGMTTGEAEAWRAGWRAARDIWAETIRRVGKQCTDDGENGEEAMVYIAEFMLSQEPPA